MLVYADHFYLHKSITRYSVHIYVTSFPYVLYKYIDMGGDGNVGICIRA